MSRTWLKAFKFTVAAIGSAIVLLVFAGGMPGNSILGKVMTFLAFVPLAPAGGIMNVIFAGPPHSVIVLVVWVILAFFTDFVTAWLVLTVIEFLRIRRVP